MTPRARVGASKAGDVGEGSMLPVAAIAADDGGETGRSSAPEDAAIVGLISVSFLTIVALLLILPLIQTVWPVFGNVVPPLEERRKPAGFPSPALLTGANGDFAVGLNKWFDDHVGFRDLFIRSKNQVDYSLFGTSRKVYIGKDGWLFARNDPDTLRNLDAAQMAALEAKFAGLARLLNDRGITLIVVGYPEKSRIYPEMTPPGFPLIPSGGNYDRFREYLRSQPSFNFIDAEEIIKREKTLTTDRVYLKTDPHTTEVGQIPVAKAIVEKIAALEGRPDIRWKENFKIGHQPIGGAEARFLSPLFPIKEAGFPYLTNRYALGHDEPDGVWDMPDPHFFEKFGATEGRPFDFEFRSRPELCPQRLPGMVLFGNSFSDLYWSLGLQHYFCFIRRARNPISRFKGFYDTMPEGTKYFFFQYYAPWLPHDAPPIDELTPQVR